MAFHTFYITRPNKGGSMNSKDPLDGNKEYAESWHIPSVELIVDPRKGKQGRTWIAVVPGENSPFVDEQSNKDLIQEIREKKIKLPRLKFTKGRRKVQDYDLCEYRFLQYSSFNVNNIKNKSARSFFEFIPSKISEERIENKIAQIETESMILGLKTDQLKAISRVTGVVASTNAFVDVKDATIKYALLNKITKPDGKALIMAALSDPLLEYTYDILDAVDRGNLRWHPSNPNTLLWSTGGLVGTVPAGTRDKARSIADQLVKDGFSVLNQIRDLLGREFVVIEELAEEKESLEEFLFASTKADAIEAMIKWNQENPSMAFLKFKGPYLYFNETQLSTEDSPKGKAGARSYFEEYEKVYQDALKAWRSVAQ